MSSNTGIVVKVNDRPNCRKNADIIDFSRIGFESFAPLTKGRINGISVTPVLESGGIPRYNFPQDIFENLHIHLSQKLQIRILRVMQF